MSRYGKERPPIPTPGTLRDSFRLRRLPPSVVYALILIIIASMIPVAMLAKARYSTSKLPKVHLVQDMAIQPRYNTQSPNELFADGRSMRLPVEGTVAHGDAELDDHYYRGFVQVQDKETGKWIIQYYRTIPPQIKVDQQTLTSGRTLFATYCAPCHGLDGRGQGQIFLRAQALKQSDFTPPADLTGEAVRDRPDGHIYNTIRNGIRSMPAYGSQIDTADRWAIVAYLRALQRSQYTSINDVPVADRDKIH